METIALILIFLGLLSIEQCLIKNIILSRFEKNIKTSMDSLSKISHEESYQKEYGITAYAVNKLEEEISIFGLARLQKKNEKTRLNFIRSFISVIEVIIFAGITYYFAINNLLGEKIIDIFQAFGIWMVLKTVGNYNKWSGPIYGRASFYEFFIPSIVNIVLAVGIGLMLTIFK
jgi:hypothetical protein